NVLWQDTRLVVTNDVLLRGALLTEAHSSPFSVHPCSTKMYHDLKQYFWWSGMKRDVATFVSKFLIYQQVKIEHQRASGLLQQLDIPVWKWDEISMDFVTGLPQTQRRHDAIWVVVDRLTKSAHFLPIRKDYSVSRLAKIFQQESYDYTVPRQRLYQTDTHVSRLVFGKVCRKLGEPGSRNWDNYICLVEFAYNNSWHASIKCAPFEMLHGIPVMDVTRETGVISLTDLQILVPSSPRVPLRATLIQFALLVDVDTKESVVDLQADKKPGASGHVFAITEGQAANTSGSLGLRRFFRYAMFIIYSIYVMYCRYIRSLGIMLSRISFHVLYGRTDFESWQQCIHLYFLGKDNGVNILKSMDESPFKMGKFKETLVEGSLHLRPEHDKVFAYLTPEEKERFKVDIRAMNMLLQGLPKDIYTLINHYTGAKDIWDNVKMLLEGSEITKDERESQLYDDFEHFHQNKGETIYEYYVSLLSWQRFGQLMACAGSDTRPPMLDRTDFESWQQRIHLSYLGKDNGVNILNSIDEGPFKMGKFKETLAEGVEGALHLGPERDRVFADLPPEEKERFKVDIRSELTKDERESQLYDDFAHLQQNKGETIHEYYVMFTKLINDMRNIKMTMPKMQLNSKNVNNMLPKWGRFVTTVKLNRGLKSSNYNHMYAYLKQHKAHVNENNMMLERHTQHAIDPLALENGVVLDEEQLLFIAGGYTNTFDYDVDEAPVQDLAFNKDNTMFMENLSSTDPIYDNVGPSYDSDILSEVQAHDNYVDNVGEYHEVHKM
nr:putative reverse transcriptase domain-containing protein [Tanacetum cinerariifolium]